MVTVRHDLFHPRCCTCHASTIVWMLLLFTCSSLARDSFEAIPQTFEGHLKYGVYIEPTYVILTKPEGRQLAFETATDHFFFDVDCTYGTTENKEVIIRDANLPSCCQMKILCQPAPSSKAFNVTVSSARPGEDYSILNTVRATSGETTHLDIFPPVRRSNHVRDASPPPCAVRPHKVDKDRYLWNLTFSAEPDELQLNVQMKPTYFRCENNNYDFTCQDQDKASFTCQDHDEARARTHLTSFFSGAPTDDHLWLSCMPCLRTFSGECLQKEPYFPANDCFCSR